MHTTSTPAEAIAKRDTLLVELDLLRHQLCDATPDELQHEAANIRHLANQCRNLRERLASE